MIKNISLFFLLFIIPLTIPAQEVKPLFVDFTSDKDYYKKVEELQLNSLHKSYLKKTGLSDRLISGNDYYPYYMLSKNKPILFPGKPYTSSITVGGQNFSGVNLKYDTFLDKIILTDTSRTFNNRVYEIALNKNIVDCFEFILYNDTLLFRYFVQNNADSFNLSEGFYEDVYSGQSKYLIKHKALVFEKEGIKEYFYSPARYINTGNGFIRIRNKRQFIKAFGSNSEDIKRYIISKAINVRNADKRQISSVLKYYDGLNRTVQK